MLVFTAFIHWQMWALWQAILDKSDRDFSIQVGISYSSWHFFFKLTFLFQAEMFLFKSRFFHVEMFIWSREVFFSCRDFLFQVKVFISCQKFFHVDIFFSRAEFFFYVKWRFLFSSRSFKWTFLNSWRDVTQEYLLAFSGNDISNKITWRLVF